MNQGLGEMKAAIISLLIGPAAVVITFALWYAFLAVALRVFGIRLPTVAWRYSIAQPENKLSRLRFFAVHTILLGGWFYLADVAEDFVRVKFGLPTPLHTYNYSVAHAIYSLVLGATFGWFMWRNSPWSNPYAHFDRLSINPETHD